MATEDKRIDQLDPVSVLDLTSLMAMQQGSEAKKVTLQQLVDYLNAQIGIGNAVLFVSQKLSDAQKLQARTNIGAAAVGEGGGGSVEGAVLYTEQNLTEKQQHQARLNIRCGSVGEVADSCVASGQNSHAEGYNTRAEGGRAHAEGSSTKAEGTCAHAEGYGTTAGPYAHAEGDLTTARGECSHAEVRGTAAEGGAGHAEGVGTIAKSESSHAEGRYTIAAKAYQHVQGQYNVSDTGIKYQGKYAHIVGNGTAEDARSNAHTLDWDGVPWYAGDRIMLGGTGMDDKNAVALMPIFVPQQLTPEQKQQACVNIGTQKTVIMEVTLGEYIQSGYSGECTVESASMTYDEVREAVNAGANVECHVSWPEDLPGPDVLPFNHINEWMEYCEFSAYVGGGDVAIVYNCILEPDGVCWFQEQALLTDERMDKVYLSTEREQSFTEEQKAQGRANLGIDEYIDQVFLGGAW